MEKEGIEAVKNEARRRIHNLVEDYMRVLASGKKESFNEERVKIAFMVPFLEALGWNPRTDEVLPEQATLTGRADFGLRLSGRTKIFIEMKRFSKSLDGHNVVKGSPRSFAEQAIQYAWGMKADWAVLTNFEETRLYDSHVKKPEDGLVWKNPLRFTEYESRFDELWLVSKQSVSSGALDAYKAKIERPPVDKAFLEDLMNCRRLLAESIMNNNPGLAYDQISESVQKILDRLIFIKNCEDRLIIPAESLWKRFKAWQETAIDKEIVIFMMDLKNMFRYFDKVYDGKLFEKHPCEDLKISNEVLEEIIDTLYGDGQHLGYNFSVIPIDVLGQAYEMYIGSIIKEKEGKARGLEIVEQQARRKAHGIYYTPEPIVDHIVRSTLGKMLERCKIPEDVSTIKILDPACGSGSFLIKAFDVTKEWYDKYNMLNRSKDASGTLDAHILPIPYPEERILTENIFGVDLDPQAVEITILNLSLKAVKTKERLPYMADHIKCGNSLIEDSEIAGNHAFTWKEEFEGVMKEGGFDVVIGNPPYISNWQLSETNRSMVTFLDEKYPSVTVGHWDIYILFIKKALELLKDNGFLSFIVPSSFAKEKYGRKLREFIIKNYTITSLSEFGAETVFKDVAREYIIFVIQKKRPNNRKTEIIHFKNLEFEESHAISQETFLDFHNFTFRTDLDDKRSSILSKISSTKCFIGNICCVNVGVVAHSKEGSSISFKKNDVIHNEFKQDYKKYIEGRDISRYSYSWKGLWMDYESKAKYFHRPKFPELFENNKIIVRRVSGENNSIISVYDDTHFYTNDNLINIIPWNDDVLKLQSPEKKWTIFKPYNYLSLKYILGILNSKLISFYFNKAIATGTLQGTYSGVYPEDVRMLPVKQMTENQQQPLIEIVDKIVSLNKRLNELGDKRTDERAVIEDEIKKTDSEIDELVYRIYGLTEDEKAIIESSPM